MQNLRHIFVDEKLNFLSPLPLRDCVLEMELITADGHISLFGKYPVHGKVNNQGFWWCRTGWRNQAWPLMSGNFTEADGRTHLSCRISVGWTLRVFLFASILLLGHVAINLTPAAIWIGIATVLAFTIFALGTVAYRLRRDRRVLLELLAMTARVGQPMPMR